MSEETQEQKAEPEVKSDSFKLIEVPTQMGLAIQTPKGEVISPDQAMIELLNEMRELKKTIVGK